MTWQDALGELVPWAKAEVRLGNERWPDVWARWSLTTLVDFIAAESETGLERGFGPTAWIYAMHVALRTVLANPSFATSEIVEAATLWMDNRRNHETTEALRARLTFMQGGGDGQRHARRAFAYALRSLTALDVAAAGSWCLAHTAAALGWLTELREGAVWPGDTNTAKELTITEDGAVFIRRWRGVPTEDDVVAAAVAQRLRG